MKAGRLLLLPMISVGLGSVLYWRYSGDLRPYCVVQFGSMLAVPVVLAAFPSRYSAARRMWFTVILYVLAKMAELLDRQIASWVATGGHPVKHLAAAGALFFYVNAVVHRRPVQSPALPPRATPGKRAPSCKLPAMHKPGALPVCAIWTREDGA
jgi:hypothetical protein